MPSWLIDSLATTDALAGVFSDDSILRDMLEFEARLALAEAQVGVIPRAAAEAIVEAARHADLDAKSIARSASESGTISIPLVEALTAAVRRTDAGAARYVHWGATSQDVADTAMVMAIRRARPVIAADHARLERSLRALSDRHAGTVMLGRTLLQPAPPTTFGLKAARYVASIVRGWSRADHAFEASAVLQFGGAAGTLAALGTRGPDVARTLADALELRLPAAPWHTDRDRLAALIAALAIYTASLGKIARDISLLMQDEVGEAAEPGGGSSTMPHKRNPAGCAVALAAATRLPGLAASFLTGMVQEHERSVGGWHAEWPTVAAAVQAAGAAAHALADAIEGLTVDADRMRRNIERTNGAIFAERVVMLAAPSAGKEAAQALVKDALELVRRDGVTLRDAISRLPDAAALLTAEQRSTIDIAAEYLGAAEALRIRLLEGTD